MQIKEYDLKEELSCASIEEGDFWHDIFVNGKKVRRIHINKYHILSETIDKSKYDLEDLEDAIERVIYKKILEN